LPATEASPDTPKVCPTNNVPSIFAALVANCKAVALPSPSCIVTKELVIPVLVETPIFNSCLYVLLINLPVSV